MISTFLVLFHPNQMSAITKDHRQWLNSLFPPLPDGRKPKDVLKDTRNFTTETLTYMTPDARAKKIVESIMSRYTTLELVPGTTDKFTVVTPTDPALVIEICGGIGGLTLGLAAEPRVGLVMAFEPKADRQLMFKRNMMVYGYGNKVMLIPGPFSPQTDIRVFQGAIGYIDPPWLPEDISGDHMTGKDQYILEGIKLKDENGKEFTLEDILTSVTNILYLVVIQVPPNYRLNPVEGWDYEVEQVHTSKKHSSTMYYCTCSELRPFLNQLHSGMGPYYKADISSFTIGGSFVDPDPLPTKNILPIAFNPTPIHAPLFPQRGTHKPVTTGAKPATITAPTVTGAKAITTVAKPVTIGLSKPAPVTIKLTPTVPKKYNDEIDEDSFASQLWSPADMDFDPSSIPIPSGRHAVASAEWVLEFQNYINELLRIVIPEDEKRNKLIEPQYMPIWIRAWTHETYNSDPMQNYERLETQGDGLLTYAFRDYIGESLPDSTSAQLSEYKSRYMSVEFQPLFAKQLKMSHWLLANGIDMASDNNVHIHEDLFESFFGAITIIMKTINRGKESVIAYNYIARIFAKTKFDKRIVRGKPKTILVQYGNRFGWELPVEHNREAGNRHIATVDFSEEGLQFINRHGKTHLTNPIGKGEAGSAKLAMTLAYKDALSRFDDAGITHEWVVAQRTKLTFSQFDPALVERVINKVMEKYGLDSLKFVTPKSTSTQHYKIIQLMGMDNANKRKVILESIRTTSEEDGKRELLELFDSKN
jgi:dsRNA-specific ribonuclease